MASKFILFSNLLLASSALAVPSSHSKALLVRRDEVPRLQPVQGAAFSSSNISVNPVWGGTIWYKAFGTFDTITGSIVVPNISGEFGAAVAFLAVIDGTIGCNGVALHVGVLGAVGRGYISYYAVYRFGQGDIEPGSLHILISASDRVTFTATASTPFDAILAFQNESNGQNSSLAVHSEYPLCGISGGWVVEQPALYGTLNTLPDFGVAAFTGCEATGPDAIVYTPFGANVLTIRQNGIPITLVEKQWVSEMTIRRISSTTS